MKVFQSSEFPFIEKYLLSAMDKKKAQQLRDYFSVKFPNPKWVEDLIESLHNVKTLENALKPIKKDPSQTRRYCSNLVVGKYYREQSIQVEFQDTMETMNFDLKLDDTFAVEVKLLEDNSNWMELSRRILNIPSDYLVKIDTDREISLAEVNKIEADVKNAVSTHKEESFSIEGQASADLHFIKVSKTGITLSIVSMRSVEGIDVPDRRRLVLSRVIDASRQLESSSLTKIVAIDTKDPLIDTELLDIMFCGSHVFQFEKRTGTPLGFSRKSDGLKNETDLFHIVDAILVFQNNKHIAYFWKPQFSDTKSLARLGTPFTCG